MCWSDEVIGALGLRREIFPECLPSTAVVGNVCADAARDTGLWEGTLIVNGGADQCMQAIGNAVVEDGVFASNIGTSSLITTAARKPALRPQAAHKYICPRLAGLLERDGRLPERRQRAQVAQPHGVRRRGLRRDQPHGGLPPLRVERPLFFLPYMAGERTPHMDPNARGVFFGLTLDHGREDMARALMEGIVFGLNDGLNVLQEIGIPCKRIVAAGGGARSDVWLQMQADIFEKDVLRSASKEQACLGAAITAAVGAGAFPDYETACAVCVEPSTSVFRPKEENVRIYRQLYPFSGRSTHPTSRTSPPSARCSKWNDAG